MMLRVSYLQLLHAPVAAAPRIGEERVSVERMVPSDCLALYRRVGGPLRWDQRMNMPGDELTAPLDSQRLHIHVLRDGAAQRIGLCEFDRGGPQIELTNFGCPRPTAADWGRGCWQRRRDCAFVPRLLHCGRHRLLEHRHAV
jgi:hypothetical protein